MLASACCGGGAMFNTMSRVTVAALAGLAVSSCSILPGHHPGTSFSGKPAPLAAERLVSRDNLRRHVVTLATQLGRRSLDGGGLNAAADYVAAEFTRLGYTVQTQEFAVGERTARNLIVEIPGVSKKDEIIVIGAHYDAADGLPAANDNASGVAAMLELARAFAGKPQARTIRFVAFANEEPPYFQTDLMGSLVYARAAKARGDKIVGMLSLECMGYFTTQKNSQHYPFPFSLFYPSTGDFIGFVSDHGSRPLLDRTIAAFRQHADIKSEGGVVPDFILGAGWSDHWSFWKQGYPAIMVTDTAPFRYPFYHTQADTPDKVDFTSLTRVVDGLIHVIADLASDAR